MTDDAQLRDRLVEVLREELSPIECDEIDGRRFVMLEGTIVLEELADAILAVIPPLRLPSSGRS